MKPEEKKLLEFYRSLAAGQQETVLAFVEFLAGRNGVVPAPVVNEPLPIPRPEEESVVKAIKRLVTTYPMLDREKFLHETAGHMNQHVIHGKPAAEVIDELEVMFARHYALFKGGE